MHITLILTDFRRKQSAEVENKITGVVKPLKVEEWNRQGKLNISNGGIQFIICQSVTYVIHQAIIFHDLMNFTVTRKDGERSSGVLLIFTDIICMVL